MGWLCAISPCAISPLTKLEPWALHSTSLYGTQNLEAVWRSPAGANPGQEAAVGERSCWWLRVFDRVKVPVPLYGGCQRQYGRGLEHSGGIPFLRWAADRTHCEKEVLCSAPRAEKIFLTIHYSANFAGPGGSAPKRRPPDRRGTREQPQHPPMPLQSHLPRPDGSSLAKSLNLAAS